MGLAANPIPAVVLLLISSLAAAPPVSAKLKTNTITYHHFKSNYTYKLHFANYSSTIASGALQVTLEGNATTDGNALNQIIAIELDTFQELWDPDSNHVGLNINSVISHKTTSLTSPEFELVAPLGTGYYFNVWIEYDGIKKFIAVYIARQNNKDDPTPSKPANPILNSSLELRGVVNQYSYFGFSASTGNITAQLNCVLRWNLTVEHYYDVNWEKIVPIVGIPTVVLLLTSVVLVLYIFCIYVFKSLV